MTETDAVEVEKQEIAGNREVDRASGDLDAIVGISECSKTIDKIANADVKQGIANGKAVDKDQTMSAPVLKSRKLTGWSTKLTMSNRR